MHDMIANPGHAWRQMEEELCLIHDLVGGTATMRQAGAKWLPREEGESWQAWRGRLNRTVLFNGIGRLIQVLSGNPFHQDLQLEGAHDAIRALTANMDGRHMSLTDFARQLLYGLLMDGMVHIQVESPQSGGQPYFLIRRARALIGAVCDEDGQLASVRLKDHLIRKTSHYGEALLSRIHLYSRDHWECWHHGNGQMRAWQKVSEGRHDLGDVPLVSVIANPTGFMTARPPLVDMAWLNLAHWQSASDQRHILHIARVPLLFGRGLQMAERGLEIGPNRLILSDDPSADLKFVEHSGAAIAAGRQDLVDLEDKMAVMGLDMIARRPVMATATGRAIDAAHCHASLDALLTSLQSGMMAAFVMAAKWMGLPRQAAGQLSISANRPFFGEIEQQARWLLDARAAGEITQSQFLAEARRRGLLAPEA